MTAAVGLLVAAFTTTKEGGDQASVSLKQDKKEHKVNFSIVIAWLSCSGRSHSGASLGTAPSAPGSVREEATRRLNCYGH